MFRASFKQKFSKFQIFIELYFTCDYKAIRKLYLQIPHGRKINAKSKTYTQNA